MSCVLWESSGPAIYGVFVPVSNAITSVDSAYGKNQPKKGKNPETNQVLDVDVKDPPMEVDLDASAYSKVPDVVHFALLHE
jgi:hypothetical protein